MAFHDQRKRLKRIMAKRNSQLPALSNELGETLITEWDDLTFFTEGGKATLETDSGDRAPVPWIRVAYVYIPSEDSIYSTDPQKLWALGSRESQRSESTRTHSMPTSALTPTTSCRADRDKDRVLKSCRPRLPARSYLVQRRPSSKGDLLHKARELPLERG